MTIPERVNRKLTLVETFISSGEPMVGLGALMMLGSYLEELDLTTCGFSYDDQVKLGERIGTILDAIEATEEESVHVKDPEDTSRVLAVKLALRGLVTRLP